MDSASVVGTAFVKADNGTALLPLELVAVFCVVPAVLLVSALAGGVMIADDGVYFTEGVSAFDPAAADADDENDVAAPAPLAPDDAFDWMYRSPSFDGFCCPSGALSSTT